MTKQEQELKNEIKQIENLLEKVINKDDLIVSGGQMTQINIVLSKLKLAYPNVRYPSIIDSCGACVFNFLNELIPVWDRLNKHKEEEVVENVVEEIIENVVEEEVVEKPKPKRTYKKKKK